MDVAKAVDRERGAVAVSALPLEGQGLLAVPQRLLLLAEDCLAPAEGVQRPGLPDPVTGLAIQVERLPGVAQGSLLVVHRQADLGQVEGRPRLPGPVAELDVQVPGPQRVRVSLVEPVDGYVAPADAAVDVRLAVRVAQAHRRLERDA